MLILRSTFFLFFFLSLLHASTQDPQHIDYTQYMQRLIELAKHNPQYPFAAMIIDQQTGKILCEGLNHASLNPTWHGEIRAINACAEKYPKLDWSKTTLITTAEPCPMCMSAIIWAGIPTVVYGTSIQYLNENKWKQIQIDSHEVSKKAPFYRGNIVEGVLHQETDKLFKKSNSNPVLI